MEHTNASLTFDQWWEEVGKEMVRQSWGDPSHADKQDWRMHYDEGATPAEAVADDISNWQM